MPVFFGPGEESTAEPVAIDINRSGVAAGRAYHLDNGERTGMYVYRWTATPGGIPVSLTGLVDASHLERQSPSAINDAGVIVGNANVYTGGLQGDGTVERAARWDAGSTTATALGGLGNGTYDYSYAYDINASGTICGAATVGGGVINQQLPHAVRWINGSTAATPLAPLSTGTNNVSESMANWINDAGTTVGWATRYSPTGTKLGTRPVRWSSTGTPAELGNLGTLSDGSFSYSVNALNASSVVVGAVGIYNGQNLAGQHAVIWKTGGTAATPLADIPDTTDVNGNSLSYGSDINDAGISVGFASYYGVPSATAVYRGVRWSADGATATVLNPIDPSDTSVAAQINSLGVIAGETGTSADGFATSRIVLWLPGQTTPIDLAARVANSGQSRFIPAVVNGLTDTGFIVGTGRYYTSSTATTFMVRTFSMLIPEAGTYGLGDANFDTHVGFDDLLILAKHYGQTNSGDVNAGDFDLNGATDFNDLLTLAKHYGTSPAAVAGATSDAFAADFALAQSLVPEPSIAMLGVVFAGTSGRRRRPASLA